MQIDWPDRPATPSAGQHRHAGWHERPVE